MLDEICKHFGGQSALAEALGVDRSAVTQWKTDGVPAFRAVQIEGITKGKFRAVDILQSKLKG